MSRIITGLGIQLPANFVQKKLALQLAAWRSNPYTLANVDTLQAA